MTNTEAIEILKSYKLILENCFTDKGDEDIKEFDLAIKALEARPQGEWIEEKLSCGNILHCSECGARPRKSEYGYDLRDNFCPNCGADMRGGRE